MKKVTIIKTDQKTRISNKICTNNPSILILEQIERNSNTKK